MSESNKGLLHRVIDEVWNQGDLSVAEEVYAADVMLHGSAPGLPPGIEGVKQVIAAQRDAFPDVRITIEDLVSEGDKVAERWTMRGTHKGEFMGIPATGKQVTSTGLVIVRIADGKIAEIWGASDQLDRMRQLGAIPS